MSISLDRTRLSRRKLSDQVVDRIKLVSTTGSDTVKGLDNLLRVRGGGSLPDDLDATVTAGALEGSNVNVANSMVELIQTQRAYEMNTKVMSVADQMMGATANIK